MRATTLTLRATWKAHLTAWFSIALFRHAEGNSDSHIKTALVGSSETVWIEDGRPALGQWQRIFFVEFDGPRTRQLRIKIVSDASA